MKITTPIFFCLLLMIGSAITYVAHASEWRQGTDAEISRVMRLVFEGRAEMRGNPASRWQWKCVDEKGC